jgi:hypothetical protein
VEGIDRHIVYPAAHRDLFIHRLNARPFVVQNIGLNSHPTHEQFIMVI